MGSVSPACSVSGVKNIIGIVLIILGLAMLVLPGQGIIMLIVGINLTDIPGERQAFLFVLRKTPVLKGMNWLRKKEEHTSL